MYDLVDEVLAERRRRSSRRGLAGGLAAASLLHGLALAAFVVAPGERPSPPLEYVAVKLVPVAALGTPERPAPAAPRPEPATPQAPPLPAPEPPRPRRPANPPPQDEARTPAGKAAPDSPAPAQPAPPGRQGSPLGSAEGSLPFGASRLEGIDPEFTYDYYLDRMLASIGAQWLPPPTEGEIRAAVRFVVEKSGEITELTLAESSGYPAFDLAALRAVQNASPLPRLPASYRKQSLSVTLIVR